MHWLSPEGAEDGAGTCGAFGGAVFKALVASLPVALILPLIPDDGPRVLAGAPIPGLPATVDTADRAEEDTLAPPELALLAQLLVGARPWALLLLDP